MKCAVEMGSGAMTYVLNLIQISSGVQKLTREFQTHRQHGNSISVF
jgi:hypothetical protein